MPKRLQHEKIIEAVLFASGDSLPLSRIAEILELDNPTARNLLLHMAEVYESEEAGIQLIEVDGCYQLCANPNYYTYTKRLASTAPKKTLTPSLQETLSIVAYKQPVTKSVIEEIRGVSADHAINRLVDYGLVMETGRLDAPGKPILFGTTEEFLRHYGLRNLDEFYISAGTFIDQAQDEGQISIQDGGSNAD